MQRLIVGTGTVGVPGVREYAYTLEETSSGWLTAALPAIATRGGQVVVVGGGLSAVEAAFKLALQHPALRVQLVAPRQLGHELPHARADRLHAALARQRIAVREDITVLAVQTNRLVTDAGLIVFSACVWALLPEHVSLSLAVPRFLRAHRTDTNSKCAC